MKTTAFFQIINSLVPYGMTRLDQVFRALREADLFPVSERGKAAPHIVALHVANVLIGANAPTAAGAPDFAKVWGRLRPVQTPTENPFADCATLVKVLERILQDPMARTGVETFKVNLDWPSASIEMKNGETFLFGDAERARREGYKTTPTRRVVEFPFYVLQQVAIDLKEHHVDDSDWTDEI